MVRTSDIGPGWKQSLTPLFGQPYPKQSVINSSSSIKNILKMYSGLILENMRNIEPWKIFRYCYKKQLFHTNFLKTLMSTGSINKTASAFYSLQTISIKA